MRERQEANAVAVREKNDDMRAFASIFLLTSLIILFVTAVAIQVSETQITPEMYVEDILNPESREVFWGIKLQHVLTFIHVVVGFLFCGVSIIHIVKNRKILKNHFSKYNK